MTGGSRGIGKAICFAFAEEGAKVAVNYISNKDKAENVAAEIKSKYGTEAYAIKADMAKESDILEMISEVNKKLRGSASERSKFYANPQKWFVLQDGNQHFNPCRMETI